jgi:hypothetical protein
MARSFLTLVLLLGMSLTAYANPEVWRGEGWSKTDFTKRLIEWDEIASGGPPKDGIPAIDSPRFGSIDQERSIDAKEAVIGLAINGDARAYPIRILMWHEIVNDTVGGVPVVVTYCPLCNSAIVFERRSEPGLLTFGTTGKLRNSDLVMYDRQTESWWQQFTGRSIVGQLAGQKLKVIPSRLESFALFKNRHPDGRVLMPTDASVRDYGRNPYEGYDTSKIPFLYRGEFPEGINPMARVIAIREGGTASAVTLELLRQEREIAIGDVVLSWKAGQASALDKMRVGGGREVGNVMAQRKDGQGRKKDVPYDVTFAFAFHAFHPSSAIIKRCPIAETHSSAPARANLERFDLIRCGPTSTN